MEVVPCMVSILAGTADVCTPWRGLTFGQVDMIKASPFEEWLPCLDVDILESSIDDIAQAMA